ncbi:MAG: glycerophosphodiester phosphodiesterase [Candidatus Saccharimonadales bacterium]
MKIVGHRGARGLAPENTIASLRKGLAHNVDALEFDLRVTKDGVVVLHHDAEITDPNGAKHTIADFSYKELQQHKADLATFIEVLEKIGQPVPLYIEIKAGEPLKPIIAILKFYLEKPNSKAEDLWLASFDQGILRESHKALPELPKVVIEKWSGVRAARRAREVNAQYICMNQRWLWWGFIRSMSRKHKLLAYTVNNPAQAKRWQAQGLYGIVTDYPDLFEK